MRKFLMVAGCVFLTGIVVQGCDVNSPDNPITDIPNPIQRPDHYERRACANKLKEQGKDTFPCWTNLKPEGATY